MGRWTKTGVLFFNAWISGGGLLESPKLSHVTEVSVSEPEDCCENLAYWPSQCQASIEICE